MTLRPYQIDPRNPPRLEIPTPFCALCQRHVTGLRYWFSPTREAYVVEAQCHGETETALLPVSIAFDDSASVTAAVVFQPKIGAPTDEHE